MFKKFIWVLVAAGILSAIVGVYFFYYSNLGEGLNIDLVRPDHIPIGAPFVLKASITNDSRTIADDAKISLSLPEGIAFVGASANKTVDSKNLGKLGVGSVIQEEFNVIVLGGSTTTKKIVAALSYLPPGVSSRFEKSAEFEIAPELTGIALGITAPEKVNGSEDFSFEVSYKNTSDLNYDGLELRLAYPPGFEFKKADLDPDIGKNVWRLGSLRSGSSMKFKIQGNLLGAVGSSAEIKAKINAEFSGESYAVAEHSVILSIAASPVAISLSVSPTDGDIISPGTLLHYIIQYSNNSDTAVKDALIKVDLKGEMFDWPSVKSNGVLNPNGGSIVWTKITNAELAVISPHTSGALEFEIKAKDSYPIRRLSDRNFVLKAECLFQATSQGGVGGASSFARLENKIKGDVKVNAKAFFRDAPSGILNQGPFPPKVDSPTNYTIHWVITNSSTDVSGVNVRATLPSGVRFLGVSKTNSGTDINYFPATSEVSWHLDKIPATKGLVDRAMEAVFQIEATPLPSSRGSFFPLIGETLITAKDDFTNALLQSQDSAITTALPDDTSVGAQGGIVVQ